MSTPTIIGLEKKQLISTIEECFACGDMNGVREAKKELDRINRILKPKSRGLSYRRPSRLRDERTLDTKFLCMEMECELHNMAEAEKLESTIATERYIKRCSNEVTRIGRLLGVLQ